MEKHKKILLCIDRNQFKQFDYTQDYNLAQISLGQNSGNNVFQYSLQKILSNSKNILEVNTSFLHIKDETFYTEIDYINNNFDCMVFSPANLISEFANIGILQELTKRIDLFKIPVYAVGLGAQSDKNYSLDFIEDVKANSVAFIKSILNTGGKIGLRGYFSADVVKQLGFKDCDYQVIGCPSLFMNGGNLKIDKNDIKESDLNVAINGFRAWNNPMCGEYLSQHKNSFFVCQDEFYKLLYSNKDFSWREYKYLADKNMNWYKAYLDNQIKLYCDFPTWYNELKNKNINFSFGCRIHGNIVPILAGIPSYIDMFDSRVKELGEYFNIPGGYIENGFISPYTIFEKSDYTLFNKNFAGKFQIFKTFMEDCGLNIETNSDIHNFTNLPPITNKVYIEDLSKRLSKDKKVVFVAHEFGLYKGHGGIASYLYNIVLWLLINTSHKVYVISSCFDTDCDLLNYENFELKFVNGNLNEQRCQVYEYCKLINPDYIEFADFNALGLECIKARVRNNEFNKTLLVTNNHTATRECWEWSHDKNFIFAPSYIQYTSLEETFQLQNSDICISPSSFLAKYVKKKYNLNQDVLVFANPYFKKLETREEIRSRIAKVVDLSQYSDTFNVVLISRFERRKHQDRLIKAIIKLNKNGLKVRCFLAGNTSSFGNHKEDYRSYLYKKLDEETKKYFLFFDFLTLEQQEKLIAIADLAVMPSTYENQPVAMVETVLRNVPVMGSVTSGITDYTKDKCLIFDPIKENLAEQISLFITKSDFEKEKIRKRQYNSLCDFLNPELCILKRLYLVNSRGDF